MQGSGSARQHLLAAAVIALLSVGLVWNASRELNAAPDESEWVTAGYRTYELVRGLSPPEDWETAYFPLGLRDWGNKNPPLGKLFIGLAVAAFRQDGERVRFVSTWPFDHAANLAAGNIPPFRLLTPARVCIALFSMACLVLVYVCSVQVQRRRYIPVLAPVALYCMLAFEQHNTRVYTDVPQLALLLAAVVAVNRHLATGREMGFYIALVLIGLSCAVKFSTGPFVVSAIACFCILIKQPRKQRLARGLALLVIPYAVFVAVNPYLYPAPVSRTLALIANWSSSKQAQQLSPSLKDSAVTSRASRVALVASRGVFSPRLSGALSRVTGGWEAELGAIAGLGMLGGAIYLGRRRGVAMRRLVVLAAVSLGASAIVTWLDQPAVLLPTLTAAGIMHLATRARSRDPMGPAALHYLTVLGGLFLFVSLWLPFDWGRYYLPILVLMPVIYTAGIAELLDVGHGENPRGPRSRT